MRKSAAVFLGVFGTASLFFMHHWPTRMVFFATLAVWLFVSAAVSILLRRVSLEAFRHLPLTLATVLAMTGLFSLLELNALRYFLMIFSGVIAALLTGWSVHEGREMVATHKPYRRMKMMLWVFDAYAVGTTLFACVVFFPQIPFWILNLFGALAYSFVSAMIWRMYVIAPRAQTALSMALICLLVSELIWVFGLLPFGYFVSGFLVTWIWYLMQILIRFHFSPQGVVWRKQMWFLGVNAILFIGILARVVRWV